jgi:hypothetical protein
LQDGFVSKAMKAINEANYDEIESLRSEIKPDHLPQLTKKWTKTLSWKTKDGFVALLCDQNDDMIKPIMLDGLNSPTVETRAYAISFIKKEPGLFDSFLDKNGMLDQKKVDETIFAYKRTRKNKI